MGEQMIPLSWAYLESMTEAIDIQLSAWEVPTVLRLRVQVVLEELFSALMEAGQGRQGRLRCSWPAPRILRLQYRVAPEGTAPRLEGLSALVGEQCTYGLKVEIGEDCCTVRVGER